ncbi:sodium:calcium antiporter [Alicyclobacillus tolerans]|uniref:sodium:calcium antiporter n=1 Tax=Alicyclobacillus tolerans TaxID=90970 RepID=UPI001F47F68E|nr:sodium:calcium antiporter [Alicyclobacillus tolerans]MCF8563278.1 sodium:calcium antiporter [Alicyclobacillus tolerans]
MQIAISMTLALAMILFGAELFTNAIEWLGYKLHLGQGAVGSVLAALGTALPETAVPITAILLGGGTTTAQEVGIGGILGAPFLLVTLGSLIVALSMVFARKTHPTMQLNVHPRTFNRDMTFFLVAYVTVTLVGVTRVQWLHDAAPWALIALYILFVILTLRDKGLLSSTEELKPLYLQRRDAVPAMALVLVQLFVALGLIVGGAQLLSKGVEVLSVRFDLPPFVLSALLIPLATELPETLNSVVWIRQGKDALALGNITGAMVFQSTLVPALGIWLTPWRLNPQALLTSSLTLSAAALVFGMFRLRKALLPSVLVGASMMYWVLPLQATAARLNMDTLYWVGAGLIAVVLIWALRAGRQARSA